MDVLQAVKSVVLYSPNDASHEVQQHSLHFLAHIARHGDVELTELHPCISLLT
jgi:hypothetical protein